MADDYVPVGGWEAAGYSAYPVTYAQPLTPTYSGGMTAGVDQFGGGGYVSRDPVSAPYASVDSSYAQMRGFNSDPYALNNSGPLMTNSFSPSRGGAGGARPSIATYGSIQNVNTAGGFAGLGGTRVGAPSPTFAPMSNYPTIPGADAPLDSRSFQPYPATPAYSSYGGDYNDVFDAPFGSQNPGGDYNDQFNVPSTAPYGDLRTGATFQDPTGGASNGSLYPGGDYNDQFNAPYDPSAGATVAGYQPQPTYASPAGGAGLDRSIATGGAQLGGFTAPAQYNDFATRGATMPGAPMSYGALLSPGSFARTAPPAADLPSRNASPASAPADFFAGGSGLPSQDAFTYGMLNPPDTINPRAGDLSGSRNFSVNAGGDYNDTFSAPYSSAFGELNREAAPQPTLTTDYTGGAGLQGGPRDAFAGQWPAEVSYDGSQNAAPDYNDLPQFHSQYDALGRDFASTQYSSYPLDRSQVPTSVVAPGTGLDELPFPNDAERMRLMRTVNGEDPQNPEAVLWSIKNRLATQQMPNQARYGNQIGTGVGSLNSGTDVVTRGNQYNAFSQAGYNRDNFANNVAGFNESNPNFQRYSDAIDGVWGGQVPDPTNGATNYFTGRTPNWAADLGAMNTTQIGAHAYMGQTPLYTPPTPPPRPDYLDQAPFPQPAQTDGRWLSYASNQLTRR